MRGKVLVIGTYSGEGVDSFDWWQKLPNLSDYGTVILDTTKILHFWNMAGRLKPAESANRRKFTPVAGIVPETTLPKRDEYVLTNVNQQDKTIKSNMEIIKRKLVEMLEFDFNVYVLFSPSVEIAHEVEWTRTFPAPTVHKEPERFVGTNDWCPISVQTVTESGKTIRLHDESYDDYFKTFNGWKYYFVPESLLINELESYYHKRWKVVPTLRAIATNNLNKPVALELSAAFHEWAHDVDEPEGGWHSAPKKHGGTLALLPAPDEYHTESSIELLLKRGKKFEETPPPTWVSSIEIPGEASLKNEIGTQKRQLEAIQSKISEFEGSLRELEKFKGLLYGTGVTLQELVRETLGKLGAGIEPSVVTDEFIINVGGRRALVEVKGNTKSISKKDLAQLITDLGEHLKATDEEVHGILVGNAWRLLPLEERGTDDKPVFPKNVIKIAENHNIGLISTAELFKAYCKVLGNAQHREDVIDKIIGKKGVISL
jgi:hypothetical protein